MARGRVEERRGESFTTHLQGSGSEDDTGTGNGLSLECHKHVGTQAVVHIVPTTHRRHTENMAPLPPHSSLCPPTPTTSQHSPDPQLWSPSLPWTKRESPWLEAGFSDSPMP